MATITESDLAPEEVAASAFNAFHAALGDSLTWDKAGELEEALFQRLAFNAAPILEAVEGKSIPAVAALVQARCYRWKQFPDTNFADLPVRERLAYEALTRHLNYLLDAEDTSDRARVEASWKDWTERKLKGLTNERSDPQAALGQGGEAGQAG